ncbi:MAG: Gfo/Idh/MocA family oxidoreductase [Mobilitalea sp.]
MKIALIGAGQRGMIYAKYAFERMKIEVVAVVDPKEEKRKAAAEVFQLAPDMIFDNVDLFFTAGKLADAVIIASMDRDHYEQTIKALDLGYNILLEKPVSPDPKECLLIQQKAHECKRNVVVCHVLRYTNFFAAIKQIIDSGELGKVITIQHAENVGNFHMAHSFVRGNWRNSEESSPIIMQKSCHDLDILVWLVGCGAEKISSFGNLQYFCRENAPEGSAERCLECKCAPECRFDVRKAYLPMAGEWPATVVSEDQTEEGLLKSLETSPYGRCVYKCDNNVCDNQVTNIVFKNGVTATFHLSGLSNKMHRSIKVMCENGDIFGDDSNNIIKVTKYSSNSKYTGEERIINVESAEGFHGGGDYGLMNDFIQEMIEEKNESRSSIDDSIESHIMAYAAEEARLTNQVIDIEELKNKLLS